MPLWDKTEEQQKEHLKMLDEVRAILDNYEIPHILTGSALLGRYRDGNLIPWCPGVVLIVIVDIYLSRCISGIIFELEKLNYKIKSSFKGHSFKIRADRNRMNVEICGYFKGENEYFRISNNRKRTIPAHFFDDPMARIIMPDGKSYTCPEDIERYLTHLYGDWKTPVRSENRKDYRASTHVRKIK